MASTDAAAEASPAPGGSDRPPACVALIFEEVGLVLAPVVLALLYVAVQWWRVFRPTTSQRGRCP